MYWNGRRIRGWSSWWLWWSSSVFLQGFFIAYFTSNILIICYMCLCAEMMMNNGWIGYVQCTLKEEQIGMLQSPTKKKKTPTQKEKKKIHNYRMAFLCFVTLVYWLPTFSTCYTAGQNDDDNTFRSKNMGFTLQVDDQWIYTEKHTRNFFPPCTQSIRYPFKVFSCHKFPIPDWHPKHLTFFITIIILPASLD